MLWVETSFWLLLYTCHLSLTTIFWWYSEANDQSWRIHWILLDVFLYIQLSFSIFLWIQKSIIKFIWQLICSKLSEKNISKRNFTRAILSSSSPRCAIIACLNVIYRKFRRAMISQLNKIWCVWACARTIARHSRPDLSCSWRNLLLILRDKQILNKNIYSFSLELFDWL